MKKSLLVLVTSALLMTMFPGAAKAAPGDPTIYPITCVSSGRVNVYLDYGINAITITNPNACHSAESLYISDGTGATWTYSQTIGGTTTSGSYDPAARPNFETGAIGSADSFTLTLASTSNSSLTFSNGYRTLDIFFNNQFNTLSPNPIAIGQQVTVTGSNLSSVTSLFLQSGSNYFSATTSNRTATQLTFTVPLTVVDFMSGVTSDVTPGIYSLNSARGKSLTVIAAPTTTAPGAPTIGVVTAISPTSAAIAFLAPTSDGGATIETYTATSSPGSITGQVMQAGSGTISMTGLTSSTAYTFTVTASNSVGTSSASSSSVSLTTPASAEEIAAQNAADVVAAASAVKAAAVAAVAKRETEKRLARDSILTQFKSSEKIGLVIFTQAEIFGITPQNIVNVQTEIAALPELSRVDITPVIKIARKYEVEGIIASDRVASIYSDTLIEIGLIPEDSKYKAALTAAIKKLPASERSSLADIAEVIGAEMAEIQARNDLLKAVLTRIAARRAA
jgi:hypothetical protein